MRLADPLVASWKAQLSLRFSSLGPRTVLAENRSDGPLVVQKPLYQEGDAVCQAIVVHPPGGIAGGDELKLDARVDAGAHALLTTPGAAKWYRTSGPWAKQQLALSVDGTLELLPRETIVFDGVLADLGCEIHLGKEARYIGWEIVCLGRAGSGERFSRGAAKLQTKILRNGKPLWLERAFIEAGGALMQSPAGLGGHSVFGTFVATIVGNVRKDVHQDVAVTQLPGLLVGRYLGDSSAHALRAFTTLWAALRPVVAGRVAVAPRIWAT